MIDAQLLELIERAIVAWERIAEVLDPPIRKEKLPAVLSTAVYSEEERERIRLRESLTKKAAQQKR
jgi:hypothetical protein